MNPKDINPKIGFNPKIINSQISLNPKVINPKIGFLIEPGFWIYADHYLISSNPYVEIYDQIDLKTVCDLLLDLMMIS
jgi:hypothetical protein